MEELLKDGNYKFEREKDLSRYPEDYKIGGNRVDFFMEGKLLFDAKAKDYITKEDYLQMKRYLEATNLKLGIIVNFREKRINMKRVINSKGKE
ncbi:GxxExxY protein [Candidatus Falkowbacteria bacterium]|nr:GxxExxY protein [Candidatus Falkowbacteria bacterium]